LNHSCTKGRSYSDIQCGIVHAAHDVDVSSCFVSLLSNGLNDQWSPATADTTKILQLGPSLLSSPHFLQSHVKWLIAKPTFSASNLNLRKQRIRFKPNTSLPKTTMLNRNYCLFCNVVSV